MDFGRGFARICETLGERGFVRICKTLGRERIHKDLGLWEDSQGFMGLWERIRKDL